MLGSSFQRRLTALSYPAANKFDSQWVKNGNKDWSDFRHLIVWLEDTKIRQYEIAERKDLRELGFPQWESAFHQYLDAVGYPKEHTSKPMHAQLTTTLDWLLGLALQLEYEDQKDDFNAAAPEVRSAAEIRSAAQGRLARAQASLIGEEYSTSTITADFPLYSIDKSTFSKKVAELCGLLQLNVTGNLALDLENCQRAVFELYSKSALTAAAASSQVAAESSASYASRIGNANSWKAHAKQALLNYPLGFSTGDEKMDYACTLLRSLFLGDLRHVQNEIDDILTIAQEFTANPKTDASLGVVGV